MNLESTLKSCLEATANGLDTGFRYDEHMLIIFGHVKVGVAICVCIFLKLADLNSSNKIGADADGCLKWQPCFRQNGRREALFRTGTSKSFVENLRICSIFGHFNNHYR